MIFACLGLCLCACRVAGAAELDLAPVQIIQAGGTDLRVANYSVPSLADWNNDGLADLIVGEQDPMLLGKVRVYLNKGVLGAPAFSTFFYAQSSGDDLAVMADGCLGVFPRVADWNGDGRGDLLAGLPDGRMRVYQDISTTLGEPAFGGGALVEAGPPWAKTPINVNGRATLALTDWNADGIRDLVMGAYDGMIRVYINEGSDGDPDLQSALVVASSLGGDLMVPTGRSSPVLADLDGDGKQDLLVGNTAGGLLFYRNEGEEGAPAFGPYTPVTSEGTVITIGTNVRSRPWVGDWNNDGRPDVLVGSHDGRVRLYASVPEPCTAFLLALASLLATARRPKRREPRRENIRAICVVAP